MEDKKRTFKSADEYIASFPADIRGLLEQVRKAVRSAAPRAEVTSSGIEAFKDEFAGYRFSKGAVQFPIDKPLPLKLLKKIVKFRVEENKKKGKK